jgi:hypothetical protein
VSRRFNSNPLSLQCRDIFLCNRCCGHSMQNGIIDSRKVRAQKVATSLQSSGGSSFVPRRSEDRLEIEMLKESLRQQDEVMRQRDKIYAQDFTQQQIVLHVS